jgi:multicomponent K+:H+ antiporter subunit E
MNAIARLFPQPLLSAALLGTWLLLHNSLAPGQILLGGTLALTLAWWVTRIWPEPVRLRQPGQWLRYLGRLLWDIVIANLEVARLILSRSAISVRPGFITMPLELENEFAIAVLATTITLTPGTISVEVLPDPRRLRIHGLDIVDEATLIATLKNRYETPLKEMFALC